MATAQEMTCLGCYATRKPGEDLDGCECDLGYGPWSPERGVIDFANSHVWVPTSTLPG